MVDLKGGDDESIDGALSQQVNAENSSKEDKLETSSDSEKPAKKKEKAPDFGHNSHSLKIIIILVVAALVLLFIIVLVVSLILIFTNSERDLTKDSNIKKATVDDQTAYITLADSVDLSSLGSIEFTFSDEKNNEYVYNTSTLSARYEITAVSLGLSSFENITSVSALLIPKESPTPPVNDANVSCTDSCSSLGKQCGNWTICDNIVNCGGCSSGICNATGQCVIVCVDQCLTEGLFCQGNMSYNCSMGSDSCIHRTNLTCGSGQECINGTCIALLECSSNSTCSSNISFTQTCSIGFCNSTGKCQSIFNSSAQICRSNASECDLASNCTGSSGACPANINKTDGTACSLGFCKQGRCVECMSDSNCYEDKCYDTEFRDYFCNLTNECQYNITTKEENSTNNNCADGIDNDCDNVNDTANDPGCVVCPNNIIEGAEVCDGADLGGKACTDLGFTGGTLACNSTCTGYDTSLCEGTASSMSPWARFWQWLFG